MKLHEYQAKNIFAKYGIPVPPGEMATTPQQASEIATRIGKPVMIKAQVHIGGRGKAGGIKKASQAWEANKVASQILGMEIKGLKVKKVLVTEKKEVKSEAYFGIIADRKSKKPVVMASAFGGVDIEDIAKRTPDLIYKLEIDPIMGIFLYQARELAAKIYNDYTIANKAAEIIVKLYRVFWENDCSLA